MSVTECDSADVGGRGVGADWMSVAAMCVVTVVASVAFSAPPERGKPSSARVDERAVADVDEMTTVEFRVPVPDHESGRVRVQAANRIAKKAAKRLKVRYNVAGVSSAEVETLEGGTVRVKAAPGTDPGWLEQIAVPDGEFELGPIIGVGEHWTDVSGELPEGIEIRQASDSLRAEDAYLWSQSRSRLDQYIQTERPQVGSAYVYPEGDAWRTLTVGDAIMTHENVEAAVVEHSPTGSPFVEVTLDAEGEQAVGFHGGTDDQRWLATMDGEAVATLARLGVHGDGKLPLRPPGHLGGEEATEWAKLVAARLSAYIPVSLVPVRDE